MTLITIKKRSEFIRSNKFSKKIYTPNFIIQKLESNENDNIPHFGFTITKKIGSAIVRNKIKRRLRNIVNELIKKMPLNFKFSYLVIAKSTMLNNNYTNIKETLFQEFKKIK